MRFVHPVCLWLIPVLAAAAALLFAFSRALARKKIAAFGPPERLPRILRSVHPRARAAKFWLVATALALLLAAAARPVAAPENQSADQAGSEFFLVLDVSKSMLVRDVAPNRLEAVRASLEEWLKTRAGDRIGLILAAGDAFVQAPLTNDFTAFREVLAQSGPFSISRGGTNLAGAIETAVGALEKSGVKKKAIVIVSDGEGLEGNAVEAAGRAHGVSGARIFTVGVGTSEGGAVPQPSRNAPEDFSKPVTSVVHDEYGRKASSRLDERALRSIASAGGGRYYRFAPGVETWNRLYAEGLKPLSRQMGEQDVRDCTELFPIPLVAALLILLGEMAVSNRRKSPPPPLSAVILPQPPNAPPAMNVTRSSIAVLVFLCFFPGQPASASTALTVEAAERLMKSDRAEEAARTLWQAAQEHPEDPYLIYNYGIAMRAAGDLNQAIAAFSEAALSPDRKLSALALENLGNAQYRLAEMLQGAGNSAGALLAWDRSVEYYEAALAERKNATTAHNLKVAQGVLEKALVEAAARTLERVRADPSIAGRTELLTVTLERFEKAASLNPGNAAAVAGREESKRLLSESFRTEAREMRAQAAAAPSASADRERLNLKANDAYERALETDASTPGLQREVTEFRQSAAKDFTDSAENALQQALADPAKPEASEARALRTQNQLSQAAAHLENALRFDPENSRAGDLKKKVLGEQEKAYVERADILEQKGDEIAERPGRSASAAAKFQASMDDYQKALELNAGNTHAAERMTAVQAKLAEKLAAAGREEMKKAEARLAAGSKADGAGKDASPGKAKGENGSPGSLQQQIGHLEKAAQSFSRAEGLAPGKNDATAGLAEASAKLDQLRSQLEAALAAAGGPGSEAGGEGGEASGKSGGEGEPPNIRFGSGRPPLNFSEVRGGTEKEGVFADRSSREVYRDW